MMKTSFGSNIRGSSVVPMRRTVTRKCREGVSVRSGRGQLIGSHEPLNDGVERNGADENFQRNAEVKGRTNWFHTELIQSTQNNFQNSVLMLFVCLLFF